MDKTGWTNIDLIPQLKKVSEEQERLYQQDRDKRICCERYGNHNSRRIHETRIRERLEPDMRFKTLYSMPLTLYEIDLLHYTSIGTDKEYFADALILKALDFEGE